MFLRCLLDNYGELAGKVLNAGLPGPAQRGRFDLIVAVDVLQFAPEPLAYLREAMEALAPGGMVYIETPNESLMSARALVRRGLGLYGANPLHHGHVNFFTPASLRVLLEKADLRVETLRQTSIAADEDRLFLTLKRKLPASVRALSLLARVSKADTLLGLGNTVCLCRARTAPAARVRGS